MKNHLADLLDVPRLQSALDSLYTSSKIPSAIIDNDGKIHTGSGWQDVCTKFHRVHPEALKRCIESDLYISGHIHEANPSITYKCPHGLVDSATPIFVEGEHIGNVFTGQLFLEEPDLDSFRAQAKTLGFDEEKYIDAVKKVPVISKQAMQENLAFVAHLTEMLAEIGLKRAREKGAEKRLRESEEIFERFMEHSPIYVFFKDENIRTLRLSKNYEAMLGMPMTEMLGKTMYDLFPSELAKNMVADDMRIMKEGKAITIEEELDGRFYSTIKFPVLIEEKPRFLAGYTMDITERKRAEEALRESEETFRVLSEQSPMGMALIDRQGRYEYVNPAFVSIFGYTLKEVPTGADWFRSAFPDPDARREAIRAWKEDFARSSAGEARPRTLDVTCKDGARKSILFHPVTLSRGRQFVLYEDVTQQRELQAQLQQAMKMEAVGRLAGGVAHDFNNLLTVITGYSELLLQKIGKESPMHGEVEEIKRAGDRAASLTQQLLAFSRKQIIEPKVLHLDSLVAEMHKMLTRLIGEDIALQATTGKSPGSVKVDPGQFQQILMNLVVNARDAMPDGGKIAIETANVDLDEVYCASHPYVTPGRFVMLSVSDTGMGMSGEVKARIFEPFFTTKERGVGTGLGLATTYGAVHQAGGSIEVYSEVGIGTTIKIFLPRVEEEVVPPAKVDRPTDHPGGTETVLIVEDEGILRNLCVQILERLGYRVLQARNGTEAIAERQGRDDRIDLLLTDVVMPGMNGAELATQLVLHNPEMKVLFTSGYTEDVITHHGVLVEGVSFIGKPYTPAGLARKIREVLGKA